MSHEATGSDGSVSHQTTVDNAKTGQSHTYDTGGHAHDYYAGSNGNVYRHDSGGWQQHSADGWQHASGDSSWADREQQARSQGGQRADTFSSGGWASRSRGGGWGDDRSGGGGGDRFGGGRFGGGGGFRRW